MPESLFTCPSMALSGNILISSMNAVTYEWLPVKCKHCGMFGHEEAICKKKEGSKKEWRPIPTKDSDASKKTATTQQHPANAPDLVHSNSYQLLDKEPNKQVDINIYLTANKVKLVGLFETKFRTINVDKVAARVVQMSTLKHFMLTRVYGMNHEQQRRQLWVDLSTLAQNISRAWCILGDFNIILYKEDRLRGDAVTD
ncbi:hypothetical protein Cgig2_001549 [Carnegiea gigantea]|uniref:Uncharacterized protein n=1 Tax=Carnegiea gigantea TaxID=171969 RepID=A0A9Q1GPQ0_9CARY|nr:hypothetical protein Cgig2_001549 [Carnegiea gigantea]